ncbi:hypothetical protein AB7M17_004442 [Bradyrhizobium sp. USDA 377]
MDEGKMIGGKLVITRRHPTTLLDPVEEPSNSIAGAMEVGAKTVALLTNSDIGANFCLAFCV